MRLVTVLSAGLLFVKQARWRTLLTVTLVGGCIIVSARLSGQSVAQGIQIFDQCGSLETADATLVVPQVITNFAPSSLNSGSGSYAYAPPFRVSFCRYFVADVYLNRFSNSWLDTATNTWRHHLINIHAGAYDLPSSPSSIGLYPTTLEDCRRWTTKIITYRKLYGEQQFTRIGEIVLPLAPTASSCIIHTEQLLAFSGVRAPDVGQDIYRIAVRTKLRGTYQEVAVTFRSAPPL